MLKLRKPSKHQLKRAVVAKLTGKTSCHDCAFHYHRVNEIPDKYFRYVADIQIVPRCALDKNPAFKVIEPSRPLTSNVQSLAWTDRMNIDFRTTHPAYQSRCERHSPRPAVHSAAAVKVPNDVLTITLPARVARHIASHFKAETQANERRVTKPDN